MGREGQAIKITATIVKMVMTVSESVEAIAIAIAMMTIMIRMVEEDYKGMIAKQTMIKILSRTIEEVNSMIMMT